MLLVLLILGICLLFFFLIGDLFFLEEKRKTKILTEHSRVCGMISDLSFLWLMSA